MRRWLTSATALAILGWCTQAVHAQPPIGYYNKPVVNPRPTVSPYLQMYRGTNVGINYYTGVRQQFETSSALQQLQHQYQHLQAPAAPVQEQDPNQQGAMTPTGQGFGGFFVYGHYFPALNRQGGQSFGQPVAGQFNPGALRR